LVVLTINISVLLKNIFNRQRLFITGEQKLIAAEKYIHEMGRAWEQILTIEFL